MDKRDHNTSSTDVIEIINNAKASKYRRSALAQEILSEKKNFGNTWALVTIVAFFVLMFIGATFFRYPNYIIKSSKLIATNLPVPIETNSSNYFSLLAKNNDIVRKDEIIAIVQGKNEFAEILKLKKVLEDTRSLNKSINNNFNKLGGIQGLFDSIFKESPRITPLKTKQLLIGINSWLKNYTLQSPTDGKLTWNLATVSPYVNLAPKKIIGYVVPKTDFYLEVPLNEDDLGKVHVGQSVQLRTDAFFYQKYGVINGRISNVSDIITNGHFTVFVSLPQVINTPITGDRPILKNGLNCRVYIVIRDQSLFTALFNSIFSNYNRP
ncbi:HlyD family efflux transporter periplasmic adaptor subunit [Mucilaginibacter paludis]|uniref:AprE-like beta-barrel domain-containing protein n=1 Tax=Mucilaginibacter paludis DSM 18603 TaxID=714943 RepID=H1Y1N9_9SPHI|nr:HlyD family secretion protein [Mucilaginibacter paludis]EHQ24698.1 hypothetical protein Mucpa_0505 [Mucilaginibacter paludis DSM 18603]